MTYNTQREKLILPEYGRSIQEMVDICVAIEDRSQRQLCAETIIGIMATMNPEGRQQPDYEHKLWDQLAILSDYRLDIDWPFDVSEAEKILSKPQPMAHPTGGARMRHYGRLIEDLFEKLKTMPEGDERDELVRLTANQMKRNLAAWGHGSMDDEKVADDLARFTDGKIQLDLSSFHFENTIPMGNSKNNGKKKK